MIHIQFLEGSIDLGLTCYAISLSKNKDCLKLLFKILFVLFCLPKKEPKKGTRKRCTARFLGGGLIEPLNYCCEQQRYLDGLIIGKSISLMAQHVMVKQIGQYKAITSFQTPTTRTY
jgi:hypothetical protein